MSWLQQKQSSLAAMVQLLLVGMGRWITLMHVTEMYYDDYAIACSRHKLSDILLGCVISTMATRWQLSFKHEH